MKINVILCTGGYNIQADIESINNGIQYIIGTPGRVKELLIKKIGELGKEI